MKTGIDLIKIERAEQIQKHDYDAAHDDKEDKGQLLDASLQAIGMVKPDYFHPAVSNGYYWPYDRESFYPLRAKDDIGKLAVAGALIAAEIDRRLRLKNSLLPDPQLDEEQREVKELEEKTSRNMDLISMFMDFIECRAGLVVPEKVFLDFFEA